MSVLFGQTCKLRGSVANWATRQAHKLKPACCLPYAHMGRGVWGLFGGASERCNKIVTGLTGNSKGQLRHSDSQISSEIVGVSGNESSEFCSSNDMLPAILILTLLCGYSHAWQISQDVRNDILNLQTSAMNATINPVYERLAYTCASSPQPLHLCAVERPIYAGHIWPATEWICHSIKSAGSRSLVGNRRWPCCCARAGAGSVHCG